MPQAPHSSCLLICCNVKGKNTSQRGCCRRAPLLLPCSGEDTEAWDAPTGAHQPLRLLGRAALLLQESMGI